MNTLTARMLERSMAAVSAFASLVPVPDRHCLQSSQHACDSWQASRPVMSGHDTLHLDTDVQVATPVSGGSSDRNTSLSKRLALQQRVAAKPVAVQQQIRRETQAQVLQLA